MPCSCGNSKCNCRVRCRCLYPYCLCVPCYMIDGNLCHLCGLPSFHRSSLSPDGWCKCFVSDSQVMLLNSRNSNNTVAVQRNLYPGDMLSSDIDQCLPIASLEVPRIFFEQNTYNEPQNSEPDELSSRLGVLSLEYEADTSSHLEGEYLPVIPLEQTEVVTNVAQSKILSVSTDRSVQAYHRNYESSIMGKHSYTFHDARSYSLPTLSYNQIDSDVAKSENQCFRRQNTSNNNGIGSLVENTGNVTEYSKSNNSVRRNVRIFTNSYFKNKNIKPPKVSTSGRSENSIRSEITKPAVSNLYGPRSYASLIGSYFQNISNIQPALDFRMTRNISYRLVRPPHTDQPFTVRSSMLNTNLSNCPPNLTRDFSRFPVFTNELNTSESTLLNPEVNRSSNEHSENIASNAIGNTSSQNVNEISSCRTYINSETGIICDGSSVTPDVTSLPRLFKDDEKVTTQTSSTNSLLTRVEDTDERMFLKISSNKNSNAELGFNTENSLSCTSDSPINTFEGRHKKESMLSKASTSAENISIVQSIYKCGATTSLTHADGSTADRKRNDSELMEIKNATFSSELLPDAFDSQDSGLGDSKMSTNSKSTLLPPRVSHSRDNKLENSNGSNKMETTVFLTHASDLRDTLEYSEVLEGMKTSASSIHVSDLLDEFESCKVLENVETNILSTYTTCLEDELDVPKMLNDMKSTSSLLHASDPSDEYKLLESVLTDSSTSTSSSQ